MHSIRALVIALLPFGLIGSAEAATPLVAGKYAMMGWHICQMVVAAPTTTIPKITGLQKVNGNVVDVMTQNTTVATGFENDLSGGKGIISMTVGSVTFPSTPSSSGNVAMSTVEVLGHAMRNLTIPAPVGSGDNVGLKRNPPTGASNSTGTFIFQTATTLKVGTDVYDVSVADIDANGVAHVINMIRRPKANEYCMDASTLTKQ